MLLPQLPLRLLAVGDTAVLSASSYQQTASSYQQIGMLCTSVRWVAETRLPLWLVKAYEEGAKPAAAAAAAAAAYGALWGLYSGAQAAKQAEETGRTECQRRTCPCG